MSVFMPTARAGAEIQQGPIRFKNLLKEAESRLEAQEIRKPEIEALLNPAQERLQDDSFWQHQADGLAFFLARDFAAAAITSVKSSSATKCPARLPMRSAMT